MDEKLTVAHVISDAGIGGAQVYVLQLLQRMNVDFQLIVICPKEGYYVDKYKQEAAEVIGIDFQVPHHRLLLQLRSIFRQQQVDVVHAHLMKACVFSAFAVVGLKGVRVLASLHGDLAARNYSVMAFRLFSSLNWLAARTNIHYLCISNAERQDLLKQGVPKQKLSVVYNAVDTKYFNFHSINYKEGDPLKAVFIGRLHESKGILTLLRVASRLQNVQFTIVGEGHLKSTVQQAAAQLDNIQLYPFQQDVRPFLQAAHVFVLPSNWEGFGMAIAEAMAVGRAVVSTRVGGIPELVGERKGGFLCASRDVDCIIDAILKFKDQPELMEHFGAYNRNRVEQQFSLTILAKRLHKIYSPHP